MAQSQRPKVSVVSIALRDEELDLLRECLKHQTYDNFEFIPVTGNISIPEAWNKGIEKARGDIILFTESDVEVPEDWVEKMVENVKKNDGFAMSSEVVTTKRDWCMSSVGIKSEIAKNTKFDESFQIAEDTEWFERIKQKGFELKREKNPIVYHHKSKDPRKNLKWAFLRGKQHVKIAKKHFGKNPQMNIKRIIKSRMYHITKEILELLGVICDLLAGI